MRKKVMCTGCTASRVPASLQELETRLRACVTCKLDIACHAPLAQGTRLRVLAERAFGPASVAEIIDRIQSSPGISVSRAEDTAELEVAGEPLATGGDEEHDQEPDGASSSTPDDGRLPTYAAITWTKISHLERSTTPGVTLCGRDIPERATPASEEQRRCSHCHTALKTECGEIN